MTAATTEAQRNTVGYSATGGQVWPRRCAERGGARWARFYLCVFAGRQSDAASSGRASRAAAAARSPGGGEGRGPPPAGGGGSGDVPAVGGEKHAVHELRTLALGDAVEEGGEALTDTDTGPSFEDGDGEAEEVESFTLDSPQHSPPQAEAAPPPDS